MMDFFKIKDHEMMLENWEKLKQQINNPNIDEYTKFKRSPTVVQRFYTDKSIFLTGATGFMGKCFVEKVLRDCSDLKHLYVLVRSKKGVTIQDKMKKYFSNIIFNRLRKINPNFEDKVVLVEGDISEDRLGMSAENRQMLIDNVDIMVHNGATVKFKEVVTIALKTNVLSTVAMLELASACKHIKAFVYVSTAYSHCYMERIKEEFYESPADLKTIYDIIATDQKAEKGLSEANITKFLGKWPNIYTFTKAVSEDLVRQYGEKVNFPCCVYRPSIVVGALKEPLIGWIGNKNGPTTAFMAATLGLIHVIWPSDILDLVPVDYTINALIVSIYDVAKQWEHERRPRVYNFASSMASPTTLKRFSNYAKRMVPTLGSVYSVWYPSYIFTSNKWQFYILHFFLHFIPAIFADLVLLAMRKKPRALNICINITKNLPWIMYYANFPWRIQVTETRKTFERINEEDRKLFNFDIWNLNWEYLIAAKLCGGRIFLTNEPMDTVEKTRRRCIILKTLHYMILTIFYSIVTYCIVKLYFGIIN